MLAPDDLAGSRAHVKGLGKVGILTDGEVAQLLDTLDLVEEAVSYTHLAGLLLAAQLVTPAAKEIAAAALEAGLLVNPVRPDAIRVAPPLLVREGEIDAALAILATVMAPVPTGREA